MTQLRDGDVDRVAELMRDCAVTELLSRFGKLTSDEIRQKAKGDLVTVADEACERRIAAGLARIMPGVPVVGEEAVAAEPGLLAHIAEAEAAWIVDPLDGTANFARGNNRFAMIVALTQNGETVAGWILDPVRNRIAVGVRGSGVQLDGTAVRFPPALPLKQSTGFVGAKFKREFLRKIRPDVLARLRGVSTFGCAGLEYIKLLAGRSHFSFYRWTKPWDHAAGALLVQEAGGVANRHDGRPYSPTQPVDAGILVAPDARRWQELRAMFTAPAAPLLNVP
ncbi:MAG TPA: inositol monophosphatase [Vineibacter sp.]|nr:inositol monophosphatase [Vineibacter sp.]